MSNMLITRAIIVDDTGTKGQITVGVSNPGTGDQSPVARIEMVDGGIWLHLENGAWVFMPMHCVLRLDA